jgi:hypothetical protein
MREIFLNSNLNTYLLERRQICRRSHGEICLQNWAIVVGLVRQGSIGDWTILPSLYCFNQPVRTKLTKWVGKLFVTIFETGKLFFAFAESLYILFKILGSLTLKVMALYFELNLYKTT